ncbi:MAG: BrnT family toxin [Gemmatimonadaceae bacterium]
MEFEWDPPKGAVNLHKHGVSFDEAATVFLDQLAVSGADPDHSVGESRYITFGVSSLGKLLAVSHTYRPGGIRIVSARPVTRVERNIYEEG